MPPPLLPPSTPSDAAALTDRTRSVGGPIDFCVLTGGEPFLQADARLIEAMHDAGYTVSVETNGTVPLEETFWSDEAERLEVAEKLAVEIATENPAWSVSVQTHKILGVA